MRVLLALVVLTQAFTCQAALASPSTPATAVSCQGHVGHDVVCEPVAAVLAPAVRGATKDDLAPGGLGTIVALVMIVAALHAGFLVAAGPQASWAPQRLVLGRHRLLALGITRV